jgi:hypothetical protein
VSSSSVRIAFTEIIQFQDYDGDRTYNPHVDTVVKTYSLKGEHFKTNPYKPFQYSSEAGPAENSTVYKISTATKDEIFSLDYFIATQAGDWKGMPLVPSGFKVNVGINNFPFKNISKPDSELLAIKSYLVSSSAGETWSWQDGYGPRGRGESLWGPGEGGIWGPGEGGIWGPGEGGIWGPEAGIPGIPHGEFPSQPRVTFGRNITKGFFSWNGTCEVDGHARAINTYVELDVKNADIVLTRSEVAAALYFTLDVDRPTTAMWDPMTGYGTNPATTVPSSAAVGMPPAVVAAVSVVCVAAVGAAIFGMWTLRRRRVERPLEERRAIHYQNGNEHKESDSHSYSVLA